MLIEILKKIKTTCPFIWTMIEQVNGCAVSMLYGASIKKGILEMSTAHAGFLYRVLQVEDAESLVELISRQPEGFDKYFKPHAFDLKTFRNVLRNHTYLLVGTFDKEKLVGYCFIRFTANKKAYRGKMVDKVYQGRGIAKQMGVVMTQIASAAGFRMFATISKKNLASLNSSKAVNEIRIIKELPDDYLYIEYVGLK